MEFLSWLEAQEHNRSLEVAVILLNSILRHRRNIGPHDAAKPDPIGKQGLHYIPRLSSFSTVLIHDFLSLYYAF